MAIYSGYPASGSKDWDGLSSTATTIVAKWTLDADGVTTVNYYANASLDTAAVTGMTVTAVTFGFRSVSYTRTGTDAVDVNVYLWNGTGYSVHAYRQTAASSLAGRNITTGLTSAAQLACINASGGTQTAVRFEVSTPITLPGSNTWTIRAYEDAVGQTGATRVVVSYTIPPPPSGDSRRRIILIG